MLYHSITEFVFLMNILGKRSDLPFSRKSDHKEKSTVSFTHVHIITCSQTQLDGIAHEQTIICRQLFAGHVMGSWPMKRKKNLRRMIINLARIFRRPCAARKKNTTQLAKYPHVLYAKPSNKMYLLCFIGIRFLIN